MMGPYCNFCGQRCFVHDPTSVGVGLLATCPKGQKLDKQKLGHCWDEVKVSSLAIECVELKARLMRSGMIRTAQKMEAVVNEVGWEAADIATGKQAIPTP